MVFRVWNRASRCSGVRSIVYYPKRNKGKREPSEAEQQAERILEKLRELERETQQQPNDTGIKKS